MEDSRFFETWATNETWRFKIQDSWFFNFYRTCIFETWRFKIQDSVETWRFKIQIQWNLKLEDSRFWWNLKIQDSRFCWNLKIQDSRFCAKLEDSRFMKPEVHVYGYEVSFIFLELLSSVEGIKLTVCVRVYFWILVNFAQVLSCVVTSLSWARSLL